MEAHVESKSYTNLRPLDVPHNKNRKLQEYFWVKQFRLVYPYGLNVDLGDGKRKNNKTSFSGVTIAQLNKPLKDITHVLHDQLNLFRNTQ